MTNQELRNLVASLAIAQKETNTRLEKKLLDFGIHLGRITKSQDKVTEEFFYNSLEKNKTVANIKVTICQS